MHFKKSSLIAFTAVSAFLATPASAAAVLVQGAGSFSGTPITASFGSSTFTFAPSGDPFGPLSISTGGTGQVNTIFGAPTTYFVDRGTVTFGPSDLYAAITSPTEIRFSNGNNFIGLRAMNGSDVFYGYAFTTDTMLNGVVFNNVANQAITASVNLPSPAAVPEPATWAMMLLGFGAMGVAVRRSRKAQRGLITASV